VKSGSFHESASSGSREPAGDSPGTSTRRPRRVFQAGLAQPSPNHAGARGNTQAAGAVSAPSSSPTSCGSGCSGSNIGRGPAGSRSPARSRANGSSKAGSNCSSGSPKSAVIVRASRSAEAAAPGSRFSESNGSANSAGSLHSCSPSLRQISPICQRGSGSPGYHLPSLRCTRPPLAKRSASAAASRLASCRFSGPSAATVHCAEVISSLETNVGSPPIVSSRPAPSSRPSTASPNAWMESI
jgi:hypothetical protein